MSTLSNTKPGRNIQILLILRSSEIRCLGSALHWTTWERILITFLRQNGPNWTVSTNFSHNWKVLLVIGNSCYYVNLYTVTIALFSVFRLIIFDFELSYPLLFSYEVKLTIVALQSTFKKDIKSTTINKLQFIEFYEQTRSDLRTREINIKPKAKNQVIKDLEKSKWENDLQGKHRCLWWKMNLRQLMTLN